MHRCRHWPRGQVDVTSAEKSTAAQQAFGQAVNSGSLDFASIVAADSSTTTRAPGQGPGLGGYRAFFSERRTAFPDLAIEVEHRSATDDDAAIAYTASGTNTGEPQGNLATGKAASWPGVQIGRFVDGLLVERWGSSDEVGMKQQLGL